ncbi:hypothetical protein [Rhizobium laguerreae]|uniref:hypothetical protein n=1 Tax=Rhizobium laguerreae TaxID=1076926 RepID=UPI001C9207F4|nr:hypothetical protein [Rhizobium laguerreae]MBY3124544.1 hypothetical protein [Rhizobium laguerreae]
MIVRCGVMAIEEVEEGSSIELEKPAAGDIFGERAVLMGRELCEGWLGLRE